jgi:hypothetical protein
MESYAVFTGALLSFTVLDRLLKKIKLEGIYYFVHALHNAFIVYLTYSDVQKTITNFSNLPLYQPNTNAIALCFALHIYHILCYRGKLRFDDWLHHGLMIGISLPIGALVPSSTLIGYSLFFSTGLPGGIDYALLFLVRNNWLSRMTEKRINQFLNVWVRAPGCCSNAAYIVAYCFQMSEGVYGKNFWLSLIPAGLMYWNGQYFMNQIVTDYVKQRVLLHNE